MKKKSRSWPSRRLEVGRLALIDLVGRGRDHRARRLAEDLAQPHHRGDPGLDQIVERPSRPDRRQLIGVADEDDVRRLRQPGQQHLHHPQVQHRGLVDDDEGGRQRSRRPVGGLPARLPLQQPVDSRRLVPGRVLEAAGGPAGRGAERDRGVGALRLGDDRRRADRLTHPGPSGQDRDPRGEGGSHRRPLLRRQSGLVRRRRLGGLVVDRRRGGGAGAHRRRHRDLAGVGALAIGAALVEDHPPGGDQDLRVGRQLDQLRGPLDQLRDREVRVALGLRLGDRVHRGRLGAAVGLGRDVAGEGDPVGAREADPVDLGQAVGVLVEDRHRPIAEAAVDRCRQVGEPVGGEFDVEVADRPRRVPGVGRRRGLLGADPPQRAEDAGRVGGDRPQNPLAVLVDQPLGPGRPDVAKRRQVGDAALAIGRVERQGAPRLQLPPVARVGLPVAADLGPFAGVQVGDGTDQREALARIGVLHLEHGIAVVLGAEDDAQHLDRAGECRRIGVEEGRDRVHRSKLAARGAADRSRREGIRSRAANWGGNRLILRTFAKERAHDEERSQEVELRKRRRHAGPVPGPQRRRRLRREQDHQQADRQGRGQEQEPRQERGQEQEPGEERGDVAETGEERGQERRDRRRRDQLRETRGRART